MEMLKNMIKMLKVKTAVLCLIVLVSHVYSSDITVNDIQEILNNQNPQIIGLIQNLQVAPFNPDLVSFEVTTENDLTVKLFLYNLKTNNVFQVESEKFSGGSKAKRKYYLKDQGLQWHPYKNWFVFYGNSLANTDNIYICRVVVPELINNFAVNGYRVKLAEDVKKVKSFCIDPAFDMTGDNIYFARKYSLRDKSAKYDRSYNLTVINDIFKYRDLKFKDVEFKTLVEKKFDQIKPVCSPADKDLIAYISYKNQKKKGEEWYHEYSLNIYNLATSEIITVDNMDGYHYYSFKWSYTGSHLFYFKALSLLRTPQNFIDDKINQVNLHFVKISKTASKFEALIQTNAKSDILVEDIVPNENSISFINENNLLVAKYDPYASVFIVDINMWRDADKNSVKKVQFDKEFDTDYPKILGSELYFVGTTYLKNKTISAVYRSNAALKLSGGQTQDVLTVKSEMDSGVSDDSQPEEEYEDEYSEDDSEVSETPTSTATVPEIKKPDNSQKISELENQITKLNGELSKLDNQITAENSNRANYENDVKTLTKESNDLQDKKNTYLVKISELKAEKSVKLSDSALKAKKISELEDQISKLSIEITKLDNQISAENVNKENYEITINNLTKETNDLLDKKNSSLASIAELKAAKSIKLESDILLTTKKNELNTLENNKLTAQNEILKLENSILSDKNELSKLETDLLSKNKEITQIKSLISNIKIEQTKTLQTENKLASFQTQLTELQSRKSIIEADITKFTQQLNNDQNSLNGLVKQLADKGMDKQNSLAAIDKLKNDKLISELKDKESRIKAKESNLAENKQKLSQIDSQISSLTATVDTENKNIVDMRTGITKLSENKLSLMNTVKELKAKKVTAQEALAKDAAEKAAKEALAKKEAEDKAVKEALAKKETEDKAAKEALAKKEAEDKAAKEALVKKEAEEKAAKEALAKKEAEDKAAKEALAKKEAEDKAAKEALAKKETEEEYSEESGDEYGEDDSSIEEDVFEDIETPSSTRRGRR